MEKRSRLSPWGNFFISLSSVVLLLLSVLFIGIFLNNQKAIRAELESKARILIESIILTRKWNANYGGVFVKKTPGMLSNPYLKNPDIETVMGELYTKKNPSLMTREISEIAAEEGTFKFRITSLTPINPNNASDEFERKALESFNQGNKETFTKETTGNSTYFRYMVPLYTETSCLHCHAEQGYRVGDVRGGISVVFNIDKAERAVSINQWVITGLFILTVVTFATATHRLIIVLRRKLETAEAQLREMATTDELTKLKNRRFILATLSEELVRAARYHRPLSCIMFDVDHFKRVNDSYGHDAGDAVLRAISDIAQANCRLNDTLGRYGGEEFLMVLPETDIRNAENVAERIRQEIEKLQISVPAQPLISATASFGVSCYFPGGEEGDSGAHRLIKYADNAMYRAKEGGRNRVEAVA
ncbi:MAG: diguanylate cyclase [Planctomycetota bacterium]